MLFISCRYLLVLLLLCSFKSNADNPWFLKDFAVSSQFQRPGDVVMDATGNSTHLYLIDQYFDIHVFRFIGAAGTPVYERWFGNNDYDQIYDKWNDQRSLVDLKIALNPYNTQFYMLKYALNTTNYVVIYRFHSYNLEWEIDSFKYSNTPYFSLRYHSPRLKIEFDASAVYVCQYNDPQSGGPVGHFIAKLSHSLTPITNITSTTGVLSIQFFCHRSPVICVWTTNHSVTEYWMSNLTVHKTYTFSLPLVSLGFNPKTVETSDGTFTYYLHHNVNDNKTVVLHKKNSSHIGVANEATQLPYNVSLPPPEAYDMIISDSGNIIAAMMTGRNPSIGLGGSDIAVWRYSPALQVKSNYILSTALHDNITKVFLYNGDQNVVVVSGSTDGALESPYSTADSRKAFVARFEYFEISSVGTKFPNYVQPAEIINITFSIIPSAANTGIPIVQFKQMNCTAVKWTGSVLSAMIPPGGLGEPAELLVKFSYLSQTPSVSVQNISYIIAPILVDVQPKQGPAVGYDISLICSEIFPDDKDVFVFVGGRPCTNLRHVNSSAVTCRAPPGTGNNVPVVISNKSWMNSTEIMYISYDKPVVFQISPSTIPTGGATISIKGYNFGPCDSSPCAFSNIIVSIDAFGLCTGGVHFNDTDVQCVAPEGYGKDRIVNASIEGRGDTTTISYMRPTISSINPTASVSKNPNVYIDGSNFGGLSASRDVIFQDVSSLQNYSCPNVTWISHQNIRCIFAGMDLPVPATLNITVVVGNQFSETSQITAFRTGISNTPPTAHSLNTSIYEEQSVILQFEGYDVDVDDSLTMYITKNPLNGFLHQLGETGGRGPLITTVFGPVPVTNSMFRVLYIPDKDFNGLDSFTFKARDFYNAESGVQTAEINVISVPDSPVPKSRIHQLDEDTELIFTLEVADPDTAASEVFVILLSLPNKGVLSYSASSNATNWELISDVPLMLLQNTVLKYRPTLNVDGTDSFDFMANDGQLNSTVNGTASFYVNPVNDAPHLNTSTLNVTVYEDTETLFEFDIYDVDVTDKLTVKITNLHLNGSMYLIDIEKGGKTLLGEGSEVKGPPYKILYIPLQNFFSATLDDYQLFNITFSDGFNNEYLSYQLQFLVLPVNDPPSILCSQPQIELPAELLVGVSSNHTFQFQTFDVDNSNLTYVLISAPHVGILMDLSGQRLHAGQSFFGNHLIFDGNRAGGGHPYSNFTVRAIDLDNAESKDCTFLLTFSCPPGLYNNIFSNGTGELCEQCPQGAVCSTDGKIGPRPQQGWWRSEDNSTFLECFPAKACPGTSANVCGTGYRGVRCAECQQNYYRFGEACIECSAINFIPSIIVLITLTGIMLFVSYIRRMKIYQSSFALMNIVINFLQTIWMLRKVRLNWPPELIAIIDYINFLNFNVELISPECLLKMSLNFSQKSRIVLALPIILLLLVTFIFALLMFINVFKSPRGSSRTFSPSNLLTSAEKYGGNNNGALLRIIKAFNIALSVLYVNLAAKSLSLFDCTYESDGKAYLDDEVALVCYQEWWYRDLPINIASVTLYVAGIPLYFGVLSYLCFQTRHPESSWEKCRQIAQVIIHCDGHFKTKCQYFVVVQLLHKLAILCISLFFSRYTGLQLVLTIISLQSILLAYIKFNPYLDQTLNTLEKMSVICSMLVLALGLPFRVDSFQLAQYRVGLVTIILSVIFGFILVVIGAALRDIFQARSKRLTERKRLTQFSTSRVAIINST